MKEFAPGMRVRCLSCRDTQAELAPERLRLHASSERFAFADCPRCGVVRMMALERAQRSGASRRSPAAAASA